MPRLHLHSAIDEIPAPAWDALAGDQPSLSHAYLSALETSGCVSPRTGWTPRHAALWDGAGTSNTVKGILRQTGIATGVLSLSDPDSLIDGLALAQGNKVNPTHWVMTSASWATLRKNKTAATGSKQYLFDPNGGIAGGTELRLFGLPVIVTDNIPAAATKNRVALVDFSKVVVARDVDAEVKILDQTWGDYDSIGIRVVSRWDTALLQSKAVTLLTEA